LEARYTIKKFIKKLSARNSSTYTVIICTPIINESIKEYIVSAQKNLSMGIRLPPYKKQKNRK
jgi:hypothetical protein